MALNIIAKGDLQPPSSPGTDLWSSIGDDPFFEIRFPFSRPAVVVCYLRCDARKINPKVYIEHGLGFREKDSVATEPGHRFVIVADVGSTGLVRAMRLDPASFPCEFTFSAETFRDREAAERAIGDRLAGDMAGAVRWDVGQLPRFRMRMSWIRLPSLGLRNSRSDVTKFIGKHYALAKAVPDVVPPQGEPVWLSTVVPVYNASKRYLDDLVGSFETQGMPGTELILSDDASPSEETISWYETFQPREHVKIIRNAVNGGIAKATNAGFAEASGTWVALLDHDDVIAPHAFKMIARTLVDNPEAAFVFTDEVVVDDWLKPTGLMLKPAYDPVLLTGVNYINHFSIYRRQRLEELGYLRTGFDGSQDYDLLLRYLEGVPENHILHLPYPAYWWRRNGKTYSRRFIDSATKAARAALVDRFARQGEPVTIEPAITETLHRVAFSMPADAEWPKISVIIPSRNSYEMIKTILSGLFENTDYPNFDVTVVDNGSNDSRVLDLYRDYQQARPNFSVLIKEEDFNFSRAVNRGIESADGDHFLLLNNDIEIRERDWLKEMVSCLRFSGTGIVGAKLLYPKGKIQHAGVMVGFGGLAGHWYLNKPADYGGPMNRLHLRNSMTCVTGAVMLISGECARTVGAWDEKNFAVAYNDVDYCLRAHKAGFRIIWTPFASMYHHESASRGSDLVGERKRRFDQEKDNLRQFHGTDGFDDPAINPGYEKRRSTPGLEMPTKLAKPRPGLTLRDNT